MLEKLLEKNANFIAERKVFRGYQKELEILVNTLNKDKIVTISGIKHSGKTNLISTFLQKTDSKGKSFYFNSQLDGLGVVKTKDDLVMLMDIHVRIHGVPKIIVLHNCNNIEGIKAFITQLYRVKKYKIIIAGNNIKAEGVTDLPLFPLRTDLQNFENHIFGGIPEVKIIPDLHYKAFLLEALKHDIISRDVLDAYNIKNIPLFYKVIHFLAENPGYYSQREIHRSLKEHGVDISLLTLIDYLGAALNTQILHRSYLYDFKQQHDISSKAQYFFGDIGLRYSFSGDNISYIENLVYLELLSEGYTLSGGINGRFCFEIFAQKGDKQILISIAEKNEDKNEVRKRARKLGKIEGNYDKYVIVEDIETLNIRKYEEDSVKISQVQDFLKTF